MATYMPKVLTGRCRTGSERGGQLAHAVAGDSWYEPALCGAKPGRLSNGWSEYRPAAVDCPKCLAKLAKLEATNETVQDGTAPTEQAKPVFTWADENLGGHLDSSGNRRWNWRQSEEDWIRTGC